MPNHSKKVQGSPRVGTASASVDALASRALTLVARRNLKTDTPLDDAFANRLRDAAADGDKDDVNALIKDMLATGIAGEAIATVYIPHVARQLGDEWCDDTLSFARVTIGAARLQSALRMLGTEWASHNGDDDVGRKAGVVVIVAKDTYHTLGAMVLCGQLRRLGLSVRIAMGATPQDLGILFSDSAFDGVLISASEAESLDSLTECVDAIRQSASACPPIVVGGGVLDQDVDVPAVTGADFATKDPFEAIEYCGLTKRILKAASFAETRS